MGGQKEDLIAQLAPVQIPTVSWLPAHGWWFSLLGLALMAFALNHWRLFYKSRLWQRQAFAELKSLRSNQAQNDPGKLLSDLSKLVRRVSLVADLRHEVAALQGQAWLDYLDSVCEKPTFTSGIGRLLETGPYQRSPELSASDLQQLLDAVDTLIRATGRKARSTDGIRG